MINLRYIKSFPRCRCMYICSCCSIGFFFFFITIFIQYSRSSVCYPPRFDEELFDRPNEWKYQNSITGEWYRWGSTHKNQNNEFEWPIQWLNVAPTSYLGVIIYLTTHSEVGGLEMSLTYLSRHLADNSRPVVIFHEGDLDDNNTQQSLARAAGPRTPLAFEHIQFTVNFSRSQTIHRRTVAASYYDMCRFFTLMLPNHPLLTLFTYYWRLDAHSFIYGLKPIKDPFEIMRQQKLQYAFVMANEESIHYSVDLFSVFSQFLNKHCLKSSSAVWRTQKGWFDDYSAAIIFTNFAIANVSFFRDHPLVRAWLRRTDRHGGIYRYRWGDAPIHTLAVTQFLKRNEVARLRYFGYIHRIEYVCPKGTYGEKCTEQVKPFLMDPTAKYTQYDDGCYPSSWNPLCYYYPEITD